MSFKRYIFFILIFLNIYLHAQEICRDIKRVNLVNIANLNATVKIDLRYATTNNFTGKQIYPVHKCVLARPAAEALLRVHQKLQKMGLGLVVFDAYRPHSCQKILWNYCPNEQFVANPKNGSRHNRACAVDVSIYNLTTGKYLEMPTEFDDFSEKAHRNYQGSSPEAKKYAKLLETLMCEEGFESLPEEWWHFDYKGWREVPLLDIPLDSI